MEFFLNAKHWKIFSLIFGISLFVQIALDSSGILHSRDIINKNESALNGFISSQISVLIFMLVFFSWIWSVVNKFTTNFPKEVSCKSKKFKILLIFSLIYYLVVTIIIFLLANLNLSLGDNFKFILIAIFAPLHLFSLYCIYYCMFFFSKVIKTMELQREVVFKDFVSEFLMLIFFPIGIWLLQPKINEINANTRTRSEGYK